MTSPNFPPFSPPTPRSTVISIFAHRITVGAIQNICKIWVQVGFTHSHSPHDGRWWWWWWWENDGHFSCLLLAQAQVNRRNSTSFPPPHSLAIIYTHICMYTGNRIKILFNLSGDIRLFIRFCRKPPFFRCCFFTSKTKVTFVWIFSFFVCFFFSRNSQTRGRNSQCPIIFVFRWSETRKQIAGIFLLQNFERIIFFVKFVIRNKQSVTVFFKLQFFKLLNINYYILERSHVGKKYFKRFFKIKIINFKRIFQLYI